MLWEKISPKYGSEGLWRVKDVVAATDDCAVSLDGNRIFLL